MNPTLHTVVTMPDFTLKAVFQNGEVRMYEVSRLFGEIPEFATLPAMPGLFEQASVDPSGRAVIWNDELDLASEEIYFNGMTV